jgi:hypothetical protein
MDSGIYKIAFSSGKFYIGKSENIPQRWKTHAKNLQKSTHTKKMQAEYDSCGEPEYTVLLPVHQDHLDLYECVFINHFWSPLILNTTKPRAMVADEISVYLSIYDELEFNGQSVMLHSTLQHITTLREHHHKLSALQAKLDALDSRSIVLPEEAKHALDTLNQKAHGYLQELNRLQKLSWWDRLFNYKVYV